MKPFVLLTALLFAATIASPSFANAEDEPKKVQSIQWNSAWQQFKANWKGIGKDVRDAGVDVGRAFKNDFQKVPENFRNSCKEAKKELKAFTGSAHKQPTSP